MFCPKCGKNIGSHDRFCRYCGAVLKGKKTNNSNSSNSNVKISINGNRQSRRKKGNVLGAINRAYKSGALGGGLAAINDASDKIWKALKNNRY